MTGNGQQTGRSYTRARRMPWVVGKIQGVTLPFGPYTATQLGVLLAGAWLLVVTFRFWSHLGPAGLVTLAVPPALAWATRHAKIEGRSPARALAGYVALLAEPCQGRIAGKLARYPRPVAICGKIRIGAIAAVSGNSTEPCPAPTALQALLAVARD